MRVIVKDSLFNSQVPSEWKSVQRLFQRAATGQHTLDVQGNPEKVIESWFFRHAVPLANQTEWTELVFRTLGGDPFTPRKEPSKKAVVDETLNTTRRHERGFDLPTAEVGDWAEGPLEVLMENNSDWLLVRLAARIDSEQTGDVQLNDAMDHHWLKPDGRGGTGELEKSVTNSPILRRCLALIDSDRDGWDQNASMKARCIQVAGETHGIPVHVLRGREMENYIPESLWWRPTPPASRPRQPAKRAKEGHLWGRLRSILERDRLKLEGKHGKEAFDEVYKAVNTKASRRITDASLRSLIYERQRMSQQERAVDDLKARLSEKTTSRGVDRFSQTLETVPFNEIENHIPSVLIEDLIKIAGSLKEWL